MSYDQAISENSDSVRFFEKREPILIAWECTMYLERTMTLVAEVCRMVAGLGEGQWVKEEMEERQGLNNRGQVMRKLERPGSSDRKGGNCARGWFAFGDRVVPCFPYVSI